MISVQKTKEQKELDRKKNGSEQVELLQEELELEREKKEIISSLYDDWIYEYNIREKKIITISGSAKYGFSGEKENSPTYLRLEDLHPDDRTAFSLGCRGREDKSSDPLYVEARVKVSGEYRWISLTTIVLTDRAGDAVSVIGKISDIDTRKKEELRLQEQAMQDAMTGLLNRTGFRNRVELVLDELVNGRKATPALLLADIDKFKDINDNYGHLYGDTVIVAMAEVLRTVFGEEGCLGRFGGDEFTVFLPDVTKEVLLEKVIRFRELFSADTENSEDGVRTTCSVGISCYGEDGVTLEALMQNADSALYSVKENGRDNFAFCTEEIKKKFSSGVRPEDKAEPLPDENRISEEIAEFAMEFLEGSKDLKSALSVLIEKIGRRFRLATVTVSEYNEKNSPTVSYYWADAGKEAPSDQSMYLPLEERKIIRDQVYKNQMFEFADVEEVEGQSSLYRLFKSMGVRAMMQFPLSNEGSVFGYISYTDTRVRNWTEVERTSLTMISKVIANYIEREKAYHKIERKVELMKSFDEVTGLLKYDKFKEVAQTFLNQAGDMQYGLVSVDFANFKYFNEVYGFRCGDEVLEDFASLVAKHNPRAVAACRDYADNFLVMVRVYSPESFLFNVESYNNTFAKNQNEKFIDSKLELCCGLYVITNPEIGIVQAIDNANIARKILKAKEHSGILMFEPEMKANRMREVAILHMIEEAIENSEFRMYLQPKISLETGALVGAEALARWEKPDGQVASPAEFIPPLEKSGKIVQLDFYMYETILKQLNRWKMAEYPLVPVSVNLSRHHIKDERLVEKLLHLRDTYKVDQSLIEIEITESAFIEDHKALIQVMKQLKEEGFGVSIDDFGTGYSSLGMLTELPADIVKLDKEFLKNSDSDIAKRMLRNVIRLIKDNQMSVLCEGVELKEQAEFLADAGCDTGQGYYFSKPIPVAQFEELYFKKKK